jgi:hypothetical protein
MKPMLRFLVILLVATPALNARTDLKLDGLFSDHMVMQRGQVLPVWGWAEPGKQIAVAFDGQRKTTNADAAGKWLVKLDPLEASAKGRELVVSAVSGKSRLSDVVIGDADNIHPTRKRPVGERLALAARSLSYGEKIGYSGPVFQKTAIEGGRAFISFAHLGAGLDSKGDTLEGLTIAGEDGKLIPAIAAIEDPKVTVGSAKITKPVAVRYNCAMLPEGNLFNRESLPAAHFRSDTPE